MNTAGMEWAACVAARNEIETAKARAELEKRVGVGERWIPLSNSNSKLQLADGKAVE